MDSNRKDGKLSHRGIEASYSAYGENKKYSARATITLHSGDHTTENVIELTHYFETLKEAEEQIINEIRKRIENILGN